MKHFTEEELIAYQLRESSDEAAICRHLEDCSECADISESIAETLRVFSAEPIPQPDLELNWQRLRGNLSVLSPKHRGFWRWQRAWPAVGLVTATLALLTVFGMHVRHGSDVRHNTAVNGHGPITTEPANPAIANHLVAAERLLTEVNNSSGPLDDATREQAHTLLLQNAVYVHNARESGDLARGCSAGEFWACADRAG